tara:strand:+ start:324 stop:1325 length:1002 start_codon:yes stop_codon:yes gene_type:complete
MNYDEKIFIAGASGMVGSAIKRLLIKKGYGDKKYGGEILCPNRFDLDLLNYESVKKWFSSNNPSIVILAAAKVGGILANSSQPYEFIFENLRIETNIIEASRLFGIKKLVFLGSSCIYPKFSRQPIKEEYLLSSELEKTNECYAIAKIAGLKLCEALRVQYDFDSISLMPCNLYGPGDNYNPETSHVIPALINKFYSAKKNRVKKVSCWGTGSPLREFLYVDDLAEACIFILKDWSQSENKLLFEDYMKKNSWLNIGSGHEISIKSLSEMIAEIIGYQDEISWDKRMPDGTPRKILDNTKINSLGWEPKIKLEDGLRMTIEDFEKNIYNNFEK